MQIDSKNQSNHTDIQRINTNNLKQELNNQYPQLKTLSTNLDNIGFITLHVETRQLKKWDG